MMNPRWLDYLEVGGELAFITSIVSHMSI